jgi:6,7-dimethyl-8-ribityllumazine synthase
MSKILIAVADLYPEISSVLRKPVLSLLEEEGIEHSEVCVSGIFELSSAVNIAMEHVEYSGIIILGCLIKRSTMHFNVMAYESARALQDISIYYSVPMGYGIISVDTKKQAIAQASEGGLRAAKACLQLIKIKEFYANYHDRDVSLFN